MDLWQVNQVPLLLYAGLVLLVLERAKLATKAWHKPVFIGLSIILALVPDVLMFYLEDLQLGYGGYGILLTLLFYWFDNQWIPLTIGFLALTWFYPYRYFAMWANPDNDFISAWLNVSDNVKYYSFYAPWWTFSEVWNQNNAIWSLPMIYFARQFPSNWGINKWVAYWFYPGHIAALVLIYHFLIK